MASQQISDEPLFMMIVVLTIFKYPLAMLIGCRFQSVMETPCSQLQHRHFLLPSVFALNQLSHKFQWSELYCSLYFSQ